VRRRSALTDQLRELRDLKAPRPLVVSCYLDTGGRDRPRHPQLIEAAERVARRARSDADRLDLDRGERQTVDAALGDFIDLVVHQMKERGAVRQLVTFSCRSIGLDVELRVQFPVGDRAAVGRRPLLLPLEVAIAAEPTIGLLLTDRERTRILLRELGEVVELDDLVDPVPPRTSGGGRAQARLARHADDAAHRHAKRSAEAAFRALRDVDGLELALGGAEEAVNDLAACLRPGLSSRVVAELRLPVGAGQFELAQALGDLATERSAARDAELVRRVTEEAGSPNVAAGLGPVVEALRQRRLATVLATARMRSPGASCQRCGQLALALECPSCGTATQAIDDVVEPVLEEAARQGATVVVVPDGSLERIGGVGAVLRY
jgi:peptide subunit release factor 1 (eRF1)